MELERKEWQAENNITIVFLVFELLFFIGVFFVFRQLSTNNIIKYDDYEKQPQITITYTNNIVDEIPKGDKNKIQMQLLNAVNNNLTNIDIKDSTAQFREKSINNTNVGEGVMLFSGIIDIPSLRQSYKVFHEYYLDDEPEYGSHGLFIVSCLNKLDEIIFPEFDCRDDYDQYLYNAILSRYVNYLDTEDYSVSMNDEDLSTVYINPRIDINQEKQLLVIDEVKSNIKTIGIPTEIFQYQIDNPSISTYELDDEE